MKLNVSKVLQREAEEKARVKPLPVIRTRKPRPKSTVNSPPLAVVSGQSTVDSGLLPTIENEEATTRRARGKLSSSIAFKVIEIEATLRKESAAMADLFMQGKLETPELADLYREIEKHTDHLAELYDQKEHVKRYGTLPPVVENPISLKLGIESDEAKALHYEIRRLDDLIHKSNKKMEQANSGLKAAKPSKLAEWRVKIALANGQREDLKQKLKRVNYEARDKRVGGAQE